MDQPDTASARGDGELLAEFALDGRQEAFTTVARRHAAMVLRVCGRRLGNTSDAQDAAQAVFLTLARRANSLTAKKGQVPARHAFYSRGGSALAELQQGQQMWSGSAI